LSDHFIGDCFDFNFFEEIFKQMGVIKKVNTALDNKSVRIIGRLSRYCNDNNTTLEELFKNDLYSQQIRVKDKEITVRYHIVNIYI
jgi:hypothetical protein